MEGGKMKKTLVILMILLFISQAAALNAGSAKDRTEKKHSNIAETQKLVNKAYEKIKAAQDAGEFDIEGHAGNAKDLLEQADAELKLAAKEGNKKTGGRKEKGLKEFELHSDFNK